VTAAPDPARAAALKLLEAALAKRGGLDEGLGERAYGLLSPQDRAFARALAMAALRRLGPIDRALDDRGRRGPTVSDILSSEEGRTFLLFDAALGDTP